MNVIGSFFSAFSVALVVAALGFVVCRFRAVSAAAIVPLNAWLAYGIFRDLYEPSIFDSMQVDFGGHAVAAHVFLTVLLVGAPLLGAVLQVRAKHRKTQVSVAF